MRTTLWIFVVVLNAGFLTPTAAHGMTAKVFTIDLLNADTIDKEKDHVMVSFQDGYLSKEQSWLNTLLSKAKSGIFQIKGSVKFQDEAKAVEVETNKSIDDPKGSMGRYLGMLGPLYPDLPADLEVLKIGVKMALSNDARLGKMIAALEKEKESLPVEVLSAPWIGYTKVVSVVTESLFSSAEADYPISGEYAVSFPTKEHYAVFVAGNSDNDPELAKATSSDFSFRSDKLHYRSSPVTKWSYVVIKISRPKTVQSVAKRSRRANEPWATVIRTQLDVLPTGKISEAAQLSAVADNTFTAIKNLENFLKNERSFSTFDLATGLYFYTNKSIKTIESVCKSKRFESCPIDELSQYRSTISQVHGIAEDALLARARAVEFQILAENAIMKGSIPIPSGRIVAPLLTAEEWEPFLRDKAAKSGNEEAFWNPVNLDVLKHDYIEAVKRVPRTSAECSSQVAFGGCMAWDARTNAMVRDPAVQ
jgi:hypothetical protein